MEVTYTQLLNHYKYYEDLNIRLNNLFVSFESKDYNEFNIQLNELNPFLNYDQQYIVVDEIEMFISYKSDFQSKYLTELLYKYQWLHKDIFRWYNNQILNENGQTILKDNHTLHFKFLLGFIRSIEFIISSLKELLKPKEDEFYHEFFNHDNSILPHEDFSDYKKLFIEKQEVKINLKKEIGKVFLVLMVWAVNDKLDLSKYEQVKKSNQLNVKIAHFMADNFTVNGDTKSNIHFNDNGFRSIVRQINNSNDSNQVRFYNQLNSICGKLNLTFPEKLKTIRKSS